MFPGKCRYHPDDASRVQAAFEDCLKGANNGVYDCVFRVIHRDGKVVTLHSHGHTTQAVNGDES
jgi:PAS fold